MVLKNTKAMQVKSIDWPSKRTGLSNFIANHLKVLKSTYDKGLQAEEKVLQLLTKNKYEILYHRYKTPFAEVDIILRGSRGQVVLLEVKQRSGELNDQPVVGAVQRRRLRRAAQLFIELGEEVELWLATVDKNNQIKFFSDVFD